MFYFGCVCVHAAACLVYGALSLSHAAPIWCVHACVHLRVLANWMTTTTMACDDGAVFVRGPNGEDISYFVSKVVFTLHPSFAEATRGEFVHPRAAS